MQILAPVLAAIAIGHTLQDPVAVPNDNRTPAGVMAGDTLVLRLAVTSAAWHILADSDAAFRVLALAEEGKPPSIPAPLLRVHVGTPIHVTLHNPLDDTLIVRGLGEHGGALDSLIVPPGADVEARFIAARIGTSQYWGATRGDQRLVPTRARSPVALVRPRFDSQLAGAFIVDPPGPRPDDRVFVITEFADIPPQPSGEAKRDHRGVPGREFTALNGRSWPYTERLHYALGDSVRWRIVNTTFQAHPMHLHGFFFRVDSHGNARTGVDSLYTAEQRRMAVTEVIGIGESASITWSPERPGGWIFHCHLTNHAAKLPSLVDRTAIEYPGRHGHEDADHHVVSGMNGLVLGITVGGKASPPTNWRPARRLRLFVQSDSLPNDSLRRFGYVLQRGAEPRGDSIESPGPVLVLTRGQPTSIDVVNRTPEPTSVHWHGIELESYYDGAVGWSGAPGKTAPAIRPGGRFEVRITPKRAGTFMYHTHFDELRQQWGGLVGALVVLEPGERWDPTRDLVFVISDGIPGGVVINGAPNLAPKDLVVGRTYRFRFADIAIYRQNLWVQIARDSSLVSWRPVAKDGFTLPAWQSVTRPATARVSSGETGDFEFTPDRPGELVLRIGVPSSPTSLGIQGSVRLIVSAK